MTNNNNDNNNNYYYYPLINFLIASLINN